MNPKILILVLLLNVIFLSAEYKIELNWDEFEGECNGFISGTIGPEFGFVNGVHKKSALGDALRSVGEGRSWDAKQVFYIDTEDGFFNFWIKDKFVDEDLMNDPDLIVRSQPVITISKNDKIIKKIEVKEGSGLVCKVFSLEAATGEIVESMKFYPKTRLITGKIVDAKTGDPLPEVNLLLKDYTRNQLITKTDLKGIFQFEVEIGQYKLNVSKQDYIGFDLDVIMGADETPRELYFAMSEKITDYRIVLTWDSKPKDLDAHLNGPHPQGGDFHIWYRNKILIGGKDFLDRDDMNGYGPETITIYEPANGEYSYSVHDYSNRSKTSSCWLSRSGATVQVYGDNRLLATFQIPINQKGNCWHVFKINQENRIIPINFIDYISNERNIR